jgi:hypothetical protein
VNLTILTIPVIEGCRHQGSAEVNNAYLHVLARIIYAEAGTFFQMLSAIPVIDHNNTLDKLMDQWWRQVRSIVWRSSLTGVDSFVVR